MPIHTEAGKSITTEIIWFKVKLYYQATHGGGGKEISGLYLAVHHSCVTVYISVHTSHSPLGLHIPISHQVSISKRQSVMCSLVIVQDTSGLTEAIYGKRSAARVFDN